MQFRKQKTDNQSKDKEKGGKPSRTDTLLTKKQKSREKERTMTKPNTPKLALPSLEEALNKTKESIND